MAVYHEDVHAVLSFKNTKHVLERSFNGGITRCIYVRRRKLINWWYWSKILSRHGPGWTPECNFDDNMNMRTHNTHLCNNFFVWVLRSPFSGYLNNIMYLRWIFDCFFKRGLTVPLAEWRRSKHSMWNVVCSNMDRVWDGVGDALLGLGSGY